MSLTKNVLIKASLAVEQRRRRSSLVESETDRASPFSRHDNDDVFAPACAASGSSSGSGAHPATRRRSGASAAEEDRGDGPSNDAGSPSRRDEREEENRGAPTLTPLVRRHSSRCAKRRRPFPDESLPHTRGRSSSPSAFPIILTACLGKRRKAARRWTRVEGEWVPVGGVGQKVPGGLKDRLIKLKEKRARRDARAPRPAEHVDAPSLDARAREAEVGLDAAADSLSARNSEVTPERLVVGGRLERGPDPDAAAAAKILVGNMADEAEVPWSV